MRCKVMKPSCSFDPVLKRFLSQIPTEVAVTFTTEQLEEIRKQLGDRQWHLHPLDVRLSFPIFGRWFYLVILAGRERRKQPRQQQEWGKISQFTWNYFTNFLTCTTFILILIPAILGVCYLYGSEELGENQTPGVLEERLDQLFSNWGL